MKKRSIEEERKQPPSVTDDLTVTAPYGMEGIDLGDILSDVRKEVDENKRNAVRALVRQQRAYLHSARTRKGELEEELVNTIDRIGELEEWFRRVESGDWSVIDFSELYAPNVVVDDDLGGFAPRLKSGNYKLY